MSDGRKQTLTFDRLQHSLQRDARMMLEHAVPGCLSFCQVALHQCGVDFRRMTKDELDKVLRIDVTDDGILRYLVNGKHFGSARYEFSSNKVELRFWVAGKPNADIDKMINDVNDYIDELAKEGEATTH